MEKNFPELNADDFLKIDYYRTHFNKVCKDWYNHYLLFELLEIEEKVKHKQVKKMTLLNRIKNQFELDIEYVYFISYTFENKDGGSNYGTGNCGYTIKNKIVSQADINVISEGLKKKFNIEKVNVFNVQLLNVKFGNLYSRLHYKINNLIN